MRGNRLQITVTPDMTDALQVLADSRGIGPMTMARILLAQALSQTMRAQAAKRNVPPSALMTNAEWRIHRDQIAMDLAAAEEKEREGT